MKNLQLQAVKVDETKRYHKLEVRADDRAAVGTIYVDKQLNVPTTITITVK